MTSTPIDQLNTRLLAALASHDASMRLAAALAIGTDPNPMLLDALMERCAIEPDFYVRDMLTWALIRFPAEFTVPKLLVQLHSPIAQARSQALHTLSKIREPSTWSAITPALLRDEDDEVARSAWRAAVILVPEGERRALAEELASQLGRGNREVHLSLSRALVALGEDTIMPVLQKALTHREPKIRAHARATERLLRAPESGFEFDVAQAKRAFVLERKA